MPRTVWPGVQAKRSRHRTGIEITPQPLISAPILLKGPTGLDVNRIQPTWELLAEVEPVHPVEVGVLLTRVRRGTVSARSVREVLAEIGYPVLDTEIPLAEMYAGSFGAAPTDLGQYDNLIKELKS